MEKDKQTSFEKKILTILALLAIAIPILTLLIGKAAKIPKIPTVFEQVEGTVPLYRLWGQDQKDHLYTTDATEVSQLIDQGWVGEGNSAYVYPTQEAGTVPLYRLWSNVFEDHFYTTEASVVDQLVAEGWEDQGITAYVYNNQQTGTVSWYRLWSEANGDHFYTTDTSEVDNAINNLGYIGEGVTAYVYSPLEPSVEPSVEPSLEPSVEPSIPPVPGGTLNFKVLLEGLASDQQDQKVRLYTPGVNWQKDAVLNTEGSGSVDLSELDGNSSYDFILYAHPYLTIKRNLNLANLPEVVDFGTARTGDLDGNDQINSLDWSWMKRNFGQPGDDFSG